MDVSDRISVIFRGEIIGTVNAAGADENELGLMMSGSVRAKMASTKVASAKVAGGAK
jgi:ABC-type uncharacterized transport system ATPase subunit